MTSPSIPSGSEPTGVVPLALPRSFPKASGQPDECAAKCWFQFQSCYRSVPAPPQMGCGLDLNRCLRAAKICTMARPPCQKSGSPGTPSGTKPAGPKASPYGTPPNGWRPLTVAGAVSLKSLGVIAVAAMAVLL
ncbi:hypothetical protein CRV24_009296 [Beauveria bassiana]|nr:hypothetical protein CRV24_009296 [Beauveria bassiana]KAH8707318.1 hypothetical protein HC256_010594 [Beauveria bassiana]